ncbi:MAG: sulfatase [Candidatus Diapherotrites archaeon]
MVSERPNFIIFDIDALRADRLSCYGYGGKTSPNIDKLAEEGTIFLQAISQGNWSPTAHGSLFTGMYPYAHGFIDRNVMINPKSPMLPEIIKQANYKTACFSSGGFVSKEHGFARGCDLFETNMDKLDTVKDGLLKWISNNKENSFFAFVRIIDVHASYNPPSRLKKIFCSTDKEIYIGGKKATEIGGNDNFNGIRGKDIDINTEQIQRLSELYNAGIALADEKLKTIFDRLKKEGVWENTVIIILADHGEAFMEHDNPDLPYRHIGHGMLSLYDNQIKVPFIFHGPKIPAGVRIKSLVRTMDLVPTVLSLAGIEHNCNFHGVDLTSFINDEEQEPNLVAFNEFKYHKGAHIIRSVRTSKWKLIKKVFDMKSANIFNKSNPKKHIKTYVKSAINLILNTEKRKQKFSTRIELYNLENDPEEKNNLAEKMPDLVNKFSKEIDDFFNDAKNYKLPETPEVVLSKKTEERLRGMGYL